METQPDLGELSGGLQVAASCLLQDWPSLMVFGPINPLTSPDNLRLPAPLDHLWAGSHWIKLQPNCSGLPQRFKGQI